MGIGEDFSVGSSEDDVRVTNGKDGTFTRNLPRRTRDSIVGSLPKPGLMSQHSGHHLDLLHALAYPKKQALDLPSTRRPAVLASPKPTTRIGNSSDQEDNMTNQIAELSVTDNVGPSSR